MLALAASSGDTSLGIGLWFIIVGSAVVYFLPTIAATVQKKRNAGAIFVLNVLAGWTVIGWIVAAVWAATVDPERATPKA